MTIKLENNTNVVGLFVGLGTILTGLIIALGFPGVIIGFGVIIVTVVLVHPPDKKDTSVTGN